MPNNNRLTNGGILARNRSHATSATSGLRNVATCAHTRSPTNKRSHTRVSWKTAASSSRSWVISRSCKPAICLSFCPYQSHWLTAELSLTRTSTMLPCCDNWLLGSLRYRTRLCSPPKSGTYGRTLPSCISTAIKESKAGERIVGLRSGASPITAAMVRPMPERVRHPGRAVTKAV